ncbi:MAG: hypothetical protein AAGM22_05195 [Acidobacteriota bacterium]
MIGGYPWRALWLALGASAVLLLVAAACIQGASEMGEEKPATRERVRAVLLRQREVLMALDGALGVGLGKKDFRDKDYVIVVYLASDVDEPQDPVTVEGVPVVFRVTGRIEPQQRGVPPHGQ